MFDNDLLEISGKAVIHKVAGVESNKISLKKFIDSIKNNAGDSSAMPDIFPDGLKYAVKRGNFRVVVLQQMAMPRSVYVITKDSPAPYGKDVKSEQRYLSFPYVVILILFEQEMLSGLQQVFYRNEPVDSLNNELFECNLPNVSTTGYGDLPYWFCSQYIKDVKKLSWPGKMNEVINHLWQTGFNWSSDYHEGLSQFKKYCNNPDTDKRLKTFEDWERATKKDPYFSLKINWQPTALTIKKAIDKLFDYRIPKKNVSTVNELVDLL